MRKEKCCSLFFTPYQKNITIMSKNKKLLYINIDGFSFSYYQRMLAAGKDVFAFAKEGLFFSSLKSGLVSITNPMQSAILCGAFSNKTHNFYQHYDFATNSVVRHFRTFDAQNVAQVFRSHGKSVVSVHQFMLENNPCKEGDKDCLYLTSPVSQSDFSQRFQLLEDIALGNEVHSGGKTFRYDDFPDFVALYIDDVDSLGHNNAYKDIPKRREFSLRAQDIDNRLSGIFRRLERFADIAQSRGFYDDLVILLTTDHGMTPFFGKSDLDGLVKAINDAGITAVRADHPYSGERIVVLPYTIEASLYSSSPLSEEERQKLFQTLTALPFVERVVEKSEMLSRYGMDARCAEFIVSPPKGRHFYKKDLPEDTFGASHDSLDETSQHIFGCLLSPCLQRATVEEEVSAIDLMPTVLWEFFRYVLPDAEGKILNLRKYRKDLPSVEVE